MVDKRSHKTLCKAQFKSKLDWAFVMELKGKAKMIELKSRFFRELLNRFVGEVQVFDS